MTEHDKWEFTALTTAFCNQTQIRTFSGLTSAYSVKPRCERNQSIEQTVLLSLTASFLFLSNIKCGSTLTKVYCKLLCEQEIDTQILKSFSELALNCLF